MIIMINGAFGSGKTTTAEMLQPLIASSMIFDPEEVGLMIRKMIPEEIRNNEERTDDFQDFELWRTLTVQVAEAVKKKYQKHLIVPMTIYKENNFNYIFNGFKKIDEELHHFCLIASEEMIYKRLRARGDSIGGWSFQQTAKCVVAFNNSSFKEHILTDHLRPTEIIEIILNLINDD